MRLATELHLAIISFLPNLKDAKDENDIALLQLRRTNRYFRSLVLPPTHNDLLALEMIEPFECSEYACRFCLRLRPATEFASTMLKGKTGIGGTGRWRRFCADCGFDTTVVGQSQRYCPSSRVCVNGVDWVWCKNCKLVRKDEEAKSVCVGLCKACYGTFRCMCRERCGRPQRSTAPPPATAQLLRYVFPKSSPRRRYHASDTESDEDEQTHEYDFWEEQMDRVQLDDDDWRALDP